MTLLSALICAQGSSGQAGDSLPLTVEQAVSMARARSPVSRQAEARVRGAAARARGAAAVASPILSLAQPFGKNTGGLDEDVLVTQTIELGDKRRQRVRVAAAERDAAAAERTTTGLDLDLAVRTAYFEAALADEERRLAAESLATSRQLATTAEIQFQAGDVPRSNVVRSQIELTRAEQALDAAETERANRFATLRSLLGIAEPGAANTQELSLSDGLGFAPKPYELSALQA